MGSSSNLPNPPPGWTYVFTMQVYLHIPTGTQIAEELVRDYGFPPIPLHSADAIRRWYFAEIKKAQISGKISPNQPPRFVPSQSSKTVQTPMHQFYTHHYLTSKSAWILNPEQANQPIELLLCVESFIVRTPGYQISVDSLEWLHCRTSKDSVWRSCSLVKSPQPIKLWEKDFIVTQITPPGSDPISEVACGCKLRIVGPIRPGEVPPVRWEDLGIKDVPFFSLSEMR